MQWPEPASQLGWPAWCWAAAEQIIMHSPGYYSPIPFSVNEQTILVTAAAANLAKFKLIHAEDKMLAAELWYYLACNLIHSKI